ncbi:dockerin type I domain-containing protein [Acetobacterium sp.]|uniref:dockerin type I domain-containing protein n=1 Tax=Acetobacterium sp. TaxID=1872094 RepID=UPI0035936FD7
MKKVLVKLMVLVLVLGMVLPTNLYAEENNDADANGLAAAVAEQPFSAQTQQGPIVNNLAVAVNEEINTSEAVEGEINFPDANLFNALINQGIDQNGDGVITQDEIKSLTWLYLDYKNITNLTGLEYATELYDLNLCDNPDLVNIDPIKGLMKLELLYLYNTGVSDADKLSLVRLSDQSCAVGFTSFKVITPRGLSNAFTVSSSDETIAIASIDNLYDPSIKVMAKKTGTAQINLSLGTATRSFAVTVNAPPDGAIVFPDENLLKALINQGVDQNGDGVITQEEMKNPTYLFLGSQDITDLTGLEYASNLTSLELCWNQSLSNIEPLRCLTGLKTLNLSGTSVSDADKISFIHFKNKSCAIGATTFHVIEPIGLSDVYTVSSSDEAVVVASIDITEPWAPKIKVEGKKAGIAEINFSIGTETKSFMVTVNAPPDGVITFPDENLYKALINRSVDKNGDGVITQEEMRNQPYLFLGYENITNLTGLEYATELTNLYLDGNATLSNIEPLRNLTKLETLNLANTAVSDGDRMSFIHLANQTCAIGFTAYKVIKPIGVSNAYSVSSSDETVVVASIDTSDQWEPKIKLEAKKAGTAQISFRLGTVTKSFTVTVNAPPEGIISFPDANLFKALINLGVDKNGDGAITQEEMQQRGKQGGLYLGNQNITNLSGLEYGTELSYLNLDGNANLSNIEPIKSLNKLGTLGLNGTSVSDADKLSFVRMADQTCAVGFTAFQFIKPGGLSEAYSVSSSDETVVVASIDLSKVWEPKIKLVGKKAGNAQVSFGIGNETKTFTVTVNPAPEEAIQFKDDNLVSALFSQGVDQNKDGAITQQEMKGCNGLSLGYQNITDLTGLEYGTELNWLYLDGNNNLSNIEPLKGLTKLYTLNLNETAVSDADIMSFVNLSDQNCVIGFTTFQIIEPKGLSEEFYVSSSDDTVVSATIINLQDGGASIKLEGKKAGTAQISLHLGSETKIFTVTVNAPPAGAIQFKDDRLVGALISQGVDQNGDGSITQEEMKRYGGMSLGYWDITDLSGLEYATNLKYLYLYGNTRLSNIEPLKSLSELETLELRDTVVSDADKMSFVRLEDQNCAVGFSAFKVIKPMGLSEEFTVTSSDQSVVIATIDNSQWSEPSIKLAGKKAGTAQITLSLGQSAKSFTVRVNAPPADGITFEDPNLSAALFRVGVDANKDGVISAAELAAVEELDLENYNITSIKGLEGGTSLKVLDLSYNTALSDIEPIRSLAKQLTEFDLWNTAVSATDRMSLLQVEDLTVNQGEPITWTAKPLGVLDMPATTMTLANPELATVTHDGQNIIISGKTSGTTVATINYCGVTKTFNLTISSVPTERLLGDVDGNGSVSAFDALMALQIATGKKAGTAAEIKAADVGKSGSVEAFDALRILQFATGKISTF